MGFARQTPMPRKTKYTQKIGTYKIYTDNRYVPHNICQKPCTDMNMKLGLRGRIQGASTVTFVLHTKIKVLSEVMPKTLLMLVAELGGYLGLTLGVSLLDLKTFVQS